MVAVVNRVNRGRNQVVYLSYVGYVGEKRREECSKERRKRKEKNWRDKQNVEDQLLPLKFL